MKISQTAGTTLKNNPAAVAGFRFRLLLLLIAPLAAAVGCTGERIRPPSDPACSPMVPVVAETVSSGARRNTFVYQCDDRGESLSVVTRVGPGELAFWLPAEWGGGYFVLGQVRAASGSRYEGDDLMVWVKGDEAMIEVAGELHTSCRLDVHQSIWAHARLSGVLFRGVGNEPGWSIEIRERRMDLELDYGDRLLSIEMDPVPALSPSVTGGPRVIRGRSGDETVVVEITDRACNDAMSGEPFAATVVTHIGARILHGCGRWLSRAAPHP